MNRPSEDIVGRIALAQAASCDCNTKTPDVQYHAPVCRYRVLEDASREIQRLRSQLAAARREAIEECIYALPGSIASDGYYNEQRDDWNWSIEQSVQALLALLDTPAQALAPLREAVAKPRRTPDEISRLVAAGQMFADNGDDLERETRIENARDILVEAVMITWAAAVKLGGPLSRGPIAEACAALSSAQGSTTEDRA